MFKDFTIHDLDLAPWLLGEKVTEIFALASCLVDPEIGRLGDMDTAKLVLPTGSGHLCTLSNRRRRGYGYDQRIEAFGSRGKVKADNLLESTVPVWGAEGAAAAPSWAATPPTAWKWTISPTSCRARQPPPSPMRTTSGQVVTL
ncbi:Gfo/Idh/MocA family oxidoreductase [Niveispirillum fermenti]|uniref:Gfo/Idh/MocA family protein n=1 Tax=Niveispirillum fermenti TaxID=1233113 RepID=UPI003A851234